MSETAPLPPDSKRPRRRLLLSEEERASLVQTREHHPRPYQREKAAALLKIADGQTPHQVALQGLLKPRDPDTVYGWLTYYQQHRALPLRPATGRGAFSPCRNRYHTGNDPTDGGGGRNPA